MEEDLPHPDPESQYSGTNAHLEMLKDMLMTYNMYDNKQVGTTPPPQCLWTGAFWTVLMWCRLCSRDERFVECRLCYYAR
jgi:hypothetical protein